MQKLMLALVTLALMAVLVPAGAAATGDPPQAAVSMKDMSVADLETRGDSLRFQKDYRQAIQYYKAALRKDRNNAVLYNKLGIVELQLGELRSAESDFNKAVKRHRTYAEPLNNIGVVAYMQKNYNKAVKYYKKALALSEANASFHSNLGTAWFALDNLERATAEYIRALELDPEVLLRSMQGGVAARISSPEDRAKYLYLLAKLYARRGDAEHSLECLKKAKEEGQNLADVYKDQEFASLWQDPRLAELVPPPPVPK